MMLSKFLFCILLFFVLTISSVKPDVGFDCKSISKCNSIAGYVSPNATTLSNILTLFGVNDYNYFLGANSLPFGTSPSKSVAARETIRIPFVCSCKDGSGIADNTTIYKVKAGDGMDHIARNIFSMLVTYQDIAEDNLINDVNKIEIGQPLSIPIPCSCDTVDGIQVVHYAHVVLHKQTLEMIGEEFGVSEETLLTLNHLGDAKSLKAESVLDVPLRAEAPASMSSPTPLPPAKNRNNSLILAIGIAIPSVLLLVVLSAIAFWFFCFQRKKTKPKYIDDVDDEIGNTESIQFKFSVVSTATNNFSEVNKLGEGGFGSVYKGTLSDRQEIAVKRLSKNSRQGEQEFKNEVTLVAKLQHKNLVKLVGFSLAGEEKLLIYEFMPKASLDQFLFDAVKCTQLNWERRYNIIGGVARGLVYLHEESRLKIVHRDLKASNILLDKDMKPKIADFGMARLFLRDQTQANTNRIAGTYGYMAPEYIMHGKFSVKSDVFSFGVLVLEILCGKRNSSFYKSDIARDLLSYAWRHWNNGSEIEILDPTFKDTCSRNEAVRCIHVALLCVQNNAAVRPSMPMVVKMLNSYSAIKNNLPSAPAFFTDNTGHTQTRPTSYNEEQESTKNGAPTWSVNKVSVTELYPR